MPNHFNGLDRRPFLLWVKDGEKFAQKDNTIQNQTQKGFHSPPDYNDLVQSKVNFETKTKGLRE
jgi:hypothetical protein